MAVVEEKNMALIKGLIQIMWADGKIADSERLILGSMLVNMGCSQEEIAKVGALMMSPSNIEDLAKDVTDEQFKKELLSLVIVVAMSDGEMAKQEAEFIERLAARLQFSEQELKELKAEAVQRLAAQAE